MSFMDDTNIIYNGIHFADFGFLSVNVEGNKQNHIFAPSKTLNTVRPAYRTRSIAVGQTAENLTFTLTFSLLNKNFTEKFNELIYQILDVETYKPLHFGNDDFYYNAIPFIGSISELNFTMQHQGYVSIPFACDAPHGWIDRVYSFSRKDASEAGTPWQTFQGEGNVRSGDGTYTVYPYIEIEMKTDSTADFVSFCLAKTDETSQSGIENKEASSNKTPAVTDGQWWNLWDIKPGSKIIIDGENMQFYYYTPVLLNKNFQTDDNGEIIRELSEDSLLSHMNNEEFVFGLHSNAKNAFWHRGLSIKGESNIVHGWYTMKMYVSYPVMR